MKKRGLWFGTGNRRLALALVLALLIAGLSVALFPSQQAHAASWGCEHNPVSINGTTAYACITTAQPCLRVRNLLTFAVEGCLPYRTTIYVDAQFWRADTGGGSHIWDQIWGGGLVSDAYVNTSNFNAPSPPIPWCVLISSPGGGYSESCS